jgi:hypothetical protein
MLGLVGSQTRWERHRQSDAPKPLSGTAALLVWVSTAAQAHSRRLSPVAYQTASGSVTARR